MRDAVRKIDDPVQRRNGKIRAVRTFGAVNRKG